ncbi:IS110 family transposase [Streptomyces phaeochromogenes]
MSEYDGHQYVGVDLHRRRSVIVRQPEDGVQLSAVRILNDPVALGLQIEQAGSNPDVVLEATYGWYRAADVLQAAGARVHLAHPLGVKGFAYRCVKNDLRDAAALADLLRCDGCLKPGSRHPRSVNCGNRCATGPRSSRCAPG